MVTVSAPTQFDPTEHVEGLSIQRWWDALRESNTKMLDILLQNGFDMEAKNKITGDNALILCCKNGRINHVNVLLQYNCNINYQNKHGNTALMKAILHGRENIVVRLLQERDSIDVNIKNNFGDAAICIALKQKYISIAKTLLLHGCNVNIVNEIGDFPLLLACKNGNLELIKFIIKLGGGDRSNFLKAEQKHKMNDKCNKSLYKIDPLMTAIKYNNKSSILEYLQKIRK